ncbi:MAG: hypothetical protein ACFN3I_03625, partial [Arachnia propionica]
SLLVAQSYGVAPDATLLSYVNTDRRNNTTINRVRYLIERVIANLKTWRVLHTDYRRPYNTFETTLQAVTGLIFAYTL